MIMTNIANCIALVRPVKVIFPIFTQADSNKGSDITSGYEYHKIWKWRFHWMPSSWKYFNSKSLPDRRPLPYSVPFPEDDKLVSEPDSATIVLSEV